MQLIYEDCNGDTHEVTNGFKFGHGPDDCEVLHIQKPHKPSSTGRVVCRTTTPDGHSVESTFFPSVWGMEWIEREDQGWVHPEVELKSVLDIYNEIFDQDISGDNLEDVVYAIKTITMGKLADYPPIYAVILKKWLDKQ